MPTRIEIYVGGLAACYYSEDEGVWNVVFVCDDLHPLKLSYPTASGTSYAYLREDNRDLEIRIDGGPFTHNDRPRGREFSWIFNMAAPYAHGQEELVIERRKDITDLVAMKVPAATLDTWELTPNNYFVQELVGYPGPPVEIISRVAHVMVLDLETAKDLILRVVDPKDPTFEKRFTFGASSDPIVLQFDNNCHQGCDHNDFLDLYEFVVDYIPPGTSDPRTERQFAAGQISSPRSGILRASSGSRAGVLNKSPQYGNCDPVVIDPPPDGGGS